LLCLVSDVLHEEKEDIRKTVIVEERERARRSYAASSSMDKFIERMRGGEQ
jgi:hypothetical protein